MSYEAGKKYSVVIAAAGLMESSQGTPGIEVILNCDEHGETKHVLWLTPKTKDRTASVLEEFGILPAEIPQFLEDGCERLVGQVAEIDVRAEEYRGETRVRVAWLHGPNRKPAGVKPASQKALVAAQRMFGFEADDEGLF